jgi:transcriptional regulator with XRE-family HTH domain
MSSKAQSPTLGSLLKESRFKSGLSQAEVAQILHTSQGNLSRWERDLSFPQDLDTLQRIQKFVKVNRQTFIAAVVAVVAKNTRLSLLRLFDEAETKP